MKTVTGESIEVLNPSHVRYVSASKPNSSETVNLCEILNVNLDFITRAGRCPPGPHSDVVKWEKLVEVRSMSCRSSTSAVTLMIRAVNCAASPHKGRTWPGCSIGPEGFQRDNAVCQSLAEGIFDLQYLKLHLTWYEMKNKCTSVAAGSKLMIGASYVKFLLW